MSQRAFLKQLPELEQEGLITAEQSERIRARYTADGAKQTDRTLLLFSALGGVLVGLGVILLIAHNWSDLPRWLRTVLAFLPMTAGQVLCYIALKRKNGVSHWTEPSAIGLSLGVAAAISLISQIYHIHGDLSRFLLVWSVLTLVIVYAMRSVITALLYIVIITWYAVNLRFDGFGLFSFGDRMSEMPFLYLLLLPGLAPFFVQRARTNGRGIGFFWLCLLSALSISIGSALFYDEFGLWNMLGPLGLMCAFTLVPYLFDVRELRAGAFPFIGVLNFIFLLFLYSWREVWVQLSRLSHSHTDPYPLLVLMIIGVAAYLGSLARRKPFQYTVFPEIFPLFTVVLMVGYTLPNIAAVVVNLGLLAIGVFTVIQGIKADSLARMNLGLTILAITIGMRFVDGDLSFLARGVLFILLGAGFLALNTWMLRQRKASGHA